MNKKKLVLFLYLFYYFLIFQAGIQYSTKYSVSSLRSDLNYLKIVLEKEHPSLLEVKELIK